MSEPLSSNTQASSQSFQLLVLYCDSEEQIQDEMSFNEFGQLLRGELHLEAFAATTLRSLFCVVGQGLRLRALVNFVINIDEHGVADPGFNVPLMYLAEQAGVGANLGEGDIRVASRGHCAVPWHSLNLWEAKSGAFVDRVQQRIYRNRLNLKSVIHDGVEYNPGQTLAIDNFEQCPTAHQGTGDEAAQIGTGHVCADHIDDTALNIAFTKRLEEVFGEHGKLTMQDMIKLHADQLAQAKMVYRNEVEQQQANYLNQLRTARDEVRELKVALRQEQSRNRRLQQMLRSDP